jgi:hypothetical protein
VDPVSVTQIWRSGSNCKLAAHTFERKFYKTEKDHTYRLPENDHSQDYDRRVRREENKKRAEDEYAIAILAELTA